MLDAGLAVHFTSSQTETSCYYAPCKQHTRNNTPGNDITGINVIAESRVLNVY